MNGPDKEMKIEIEPINTQKVRFIRTGQNWDKNTNYVMIKRIELFSNDPEYSEGVFTALFKSSENQDPHRSGVFISSTRYDFNSFYKLDQIKNTSTLNKENSWFQIELTQGFAVITGFRFGRGSPHKARNYKIICTCDVKDPIEDWTTLIEINEKNEDEHRDIDIYLVTQPSPPVKYIRLVQTGQNWCNNFFLKFFNFDIFGNYF